MLRATAAALFLAASPARAQENAIFATLWEGVHISVLEPQGPNINPEGPPKAAYHEITLSAADGGTTLGDCAVENAGNISEQSLGPWVGAAANFSDFPGGAARILIMAADSTEVFSWKLKLSVRPTSKSGYERREFHISSTPPKRKPRTSYQALFGEKKDDGAGTDLDRRLAALKKKSNSAILSSTSAAADDESLTARQASMRQALIDAGDARMAQNEKERQERARRKAEAQARSAAKKKKEKRIVGALFGAATAGAAVSVGASADQAMQMGSDVYQDVQDGGPRRTMATNMRLANEQAEDARRRAMEAAKAADDAGRRRQAEANRPAGGGRYATGGSGADNSGSAGGNPAADSRRSVNSIFGSEPAAAPASEPLDQHPADFIGQWVRDGSKNGTWGWVYYLESGGTGRYCRQTLNNWDAPDSGYSNNCDREREISEGSGWKNFNWRYDKTTDTLILTGDKSASFKIWREGARKSFDAAWKQ